jgi:phosphotransferase system  glucose/maltose/N-acetylglucosamine-specific IIC component
MTLTRRAQIVLGALLGAVIAFGWAWTAHAQTTTTGASTTTSRASTSTTRAATSTSRPATTTTTTRKPTTRLVFAASPTEGSPGTNITVNSVNPCIGKGKFFVLLSIGPNRLGSGPADTVGNWRFTVPVPQINPGTYGLAATCLLSRNGVDENAGIYVGPDFTVTAGSGGPPPPTTPTANKSANTALIIGLIAAVVIAIAAIAWALYLRSKHRKELAAAGAGPGAGPGPGGAPPGSRPPDTFA